MATSKDNDNVGLNDIPALDATNVENSMPGLRRSSQITVNADNSMLPVLHSYEDTVGTDAGAYVTSSLDGAAMPAGDWAGSACQRPNNSEAARLSSPQGYSDGEVRFGRSPFSPGLGMSRA